MNAFDYVIIGVLAAIVAVAIISIVHNKKKGGSCSGCGCVCSRCPSRITCEGKKEQE